jgi:peptidoglycan LD-endopeptidase LytH
MPATPRRTVPRRGPSTSWRRGLVAAGLALALTAGGGPALAAAQDLEGARDRAEGFRSELADATETYELLRAEVEQAADELGALEARVGELELEAARLEGQLADRARQVFMRGSGTSFELLLAAEGPGVGIERASLAEAVQRRETASLEEARAARLALDQAVALADRRREEFGALRDEQATLQVRLESQLDAAEQAVAGLEVLAARQREIDSGPQQGRYACPLNPDVTHFIDSWGFPRSGGRRHKGADVMGPMGAPVYAFTDGTIARHSNSQLGGTSLYLQGTDGSTYFYTHLQGYAAAGAVGTRVTAGEHIAFNGNTGNARGGAPHIHFERAPGGGGAVNPYPYLAAACF